MINDKFLDSEKEKAAHWINICPAFVEVIYSCHEQESHEHDSLLWSLS